MSLPVPVPVKVNFNVVVDADNKVTLFGEPVPTPTNVIVATLALPSSALYDPDTNKGLIELWEPEDAQGDIKCQLANSDTSSTGGPNLTGAYQVAAKKLATGLEALLCDSFDCSGAVPFNNYTTNIEYYKQRDFGRVALGMMAHYLFGHVDATAAITNDKAFVQSMLSVSAAGDDETADGAANRAAAFTKSTAGNVETWNFAASNADANLAFRLVKAIIEKGKAGNDVTSATLTQSLVSEITSTATDQTLANIVKQVIGQDSSRTQNVDGSARTREQHLLLRFYPGDTIFINIIVKKPTIQVTGYLAGANPPANTLVSEQSYALKIKLGTGIPVLDPSKLVYQTGSNNTIITGYTGTATGELTIPDGVTQIAASAFANNTASMSVICPASLTTIGNHAFNNSRITSIVAPNVTSVGVYAFANNPALLSASLPKATQIIATFHRCTALKSVNISSVVTIAPLWDDQYWHGPFAYCSALKQLTLPSTLRNINGGNPGRGQGAFHNSGLTSIIIPEGVTGLGDYAFTNCTALASVTLPSTLTSIGGSVFAGCTALTSISLPSAVTTISDYAFTNSRITSISAPNATSVGARAFADNAALVSASLPKATQIIGTFHRCTALNSVTISSVVNIAPLWNDDTNHGAFSFCTALTQITLPTTLRTISGANVNRNQGAFISCGLTSIVIPEGVTVVGDNAFNGCAALASVTLPSTLTTIGSSAFGSCTALTSISIPSAVTSIGDYAFANSRITSVSAPNATTVGVRAFADNAALVSASLPKATQIIGTFHRCTALNSVDISSVVTIAPRWDEDYWHGAFSYCSALTQINLPTTLRNINDANGRGQSAFLSCGLTSVDIPEGVAAIGSIAFLNCTALASVTLPTTLTAFNWGTYGGCTALTAIYFKGNAPTFTGTRPAGITVYYKADKTGWGSVASPKATW